MPRTNLIVSRDSEQFFVTGRARKYGAKNVLLRLSKTEHGWTQRVLTRDAYSGKCTIPLSVDLREQRTPRRPRRMALIGRQGWSVALLARGSRNLSGSDPCVLGRCRFGKRSGPTCRHFNPTMSCPKKSSMSSLRKPSAVDTCSNVSASFAMSSGEVGQVFVKYLLQGVGLGTARPRIGVGLSVQSLRVVSNSDTRARPAPSPRCAFSCAAALGRNCPRPPYSSRSVANAVGSRARTRGLPPCIRPEGCVT